MVIARAVAIAGAMFIAFPETIAGFTNTPNPAPSPIMDLLAAFESEDGLMLRVTRGPSVYSPGEPKSKWPLSTTVWRHDLPLALLAPGFFPADAAGIIFTPGSSQALCSYPVDAMTVQRRSYNKYNLSVRDSCGVSGDRSSAFLTKQIRDSSGECKFATAKEYASAYYFKPISQGSWLLKLASCHFTSVPLMLDAQKVLLQRSMHTPPGTNDRDWLRNATQSLGLAAFNEVVIAPYEPSGVGGVFWAHSGTFRSPVVEAGACRIANYLKELPPSATPLPIFEVAAVNLEKPFFGCHSEFPSYRLAPDCLTRGLGYWQSNMTDKGGYGSNFSNVFRIVNATVFLALSCTTEEQHAVVV